MKNPPRATYLDIASAREGAGNAVAVVWDAWYKKTWLGPNMVDLPIENGDFIVFFPSKIVIFW